MERLCTYFLPNDIMPYTTPAAKTNAQGNRLPKPKHRNTGNTDILKKKTGNKCIAYIKYFVLC